MRFLVGWEIDSQESTTLLFLTLLEVDTLHKVAAINGHFKFSCDDIWFGNSGIIIIAFYKIDVTDHIRVSRQDSKPNLSFIVFIFESSGFDCKKVITLSTTVQGSLPWQKN